MWMEVKNFIVVNFNAFHYLAGVYRVLQRTWRGEHQRQFCDHLWTTGWVGRLWLSTVYWNKDLAGVSNYPSLINTILYVYTVLLVKPLKLY